MALSSGSNEPRVTGCLELAGLLVRLAGEAVVERPGCGRGGRWAHPTGVWKCPKEVPSDPSSGPNGPGGSLSFLIRAIAIASIFSALLTEQLEL